MGVSFSERDNWTRGLPERGRRHAPSDLSDARSDGGVGIRKAVACCFFGPSKNINPNGFSQTVTKFAKHGLTLYV